MDEENGSPPNEPDPQSQEPDPQPTETDHKPGDVVNGYMLSEDGTQWVAVGTQPPPPDTEATKTSLWKKPGFLIPVIIVVVLILLCGFGSLLTDTSETPAEPNASTETEPTPTQEETPAEEPTPTEEPAGNQPDADGGIGDPVRDGDFEFVVTDVKTGVSQVGDSTFGENAQGEFTIVSLTVKNIGDKPATFDSGSQKGFDSNGAEISTDTAAELTVNDDAASFLEEINPGNTAKPKIVFDLPKKETLTAVELHDSPLSDGVTVSLQ